jgi:hypothetical protein
MKQRRKSRIYGFQTEWNFKAVYTQNGKKDSWWYLQLLCNYKHNGQLADLTTNNQ